MRAKHLEMASIQVDRDLKADDLPQEPTRIIERQAHASAAKLRLLGISATC